MKPECHINVYILQGMVIKQNDTMSFPIAPKYIDIYV